MKLQLAHAAPRAGQPLAAPPKLASGDWLAAATLAASNLLIFGWGAGRLGFYYDDGGWMSSLPSAGLRGLWTITRNYVPGRNLHVLLQYAIYKLAGDPAAHLAQLHLIQSAVDGLAAAAFFLLLRRLLVPATAALLAAGLFSFWPIHGETHFWLPATPQNQLTTLFVIAFCWTTLEMIRSQRGFSARRWWLALLDAGVFLFALFTYDQVLFVLALLIAGRVATAILRRWSDRWRFASIHLFYLAAIALYAWVKLRIVPGKAPSLTPDAWRLLHENILGTLASTFGKPWLLHVAPFFQTVTSTDWVLAAVAALALAAVAIALLPRVHAPRPSVFVLLLALLFYIAAYLPIWLWYISPRHHYLPSLGLFATGGVGLGWLLKCIRFRVIQLFLVLLFGAGTCFFAAADRGESRTWETSFTAKKQLFAEIRPDLEGKNVLALDEFPLSLGSAYLILPHDALFGPGLFYGRSFSLPPG
ncbi:MAG TPA: hypothetical protein VEU62_23170, partial [Bryobacterales bacterium]|nr:hypothetical protein [Bryobacterales bacterium]